jgi:hypothetical protein
MKQYALIASMIIVLMFLVAGCATTPTPIQGSIQIPQTFEKVWYRPTIARPGFVVMSDTGNFIVDNDILEFQGKKDKIKIMFSEIRSISFGRIGSDFINIWITIEYGEEKAPLYAVISAGKALGWAGGTSRIFSTIEYVIKKNNLTYIKVK